MTGLKKILKAAFSVAYYRTYLGLAERALLKMYDFKPAQPQLFILGLPRSGTTLVYQYTVHRLNVSYFTNGAGDFPLSPCIITFFQHRKYGGYFSDFSSYYGKVTGPVSPREAGRFWARFFGFEGYYRWSEMKPHDIHILQKTIGCIENIYGNAPFVNKNVKHMLRIDALEKTFPNAIFLLIRRNIKDVALSLLRARYAINENPNIWYSVKPSNFVEIKDLSPVEQIVYQLISLNERIQTDITSMVADRIIEVEYENFCSEPESLIKRIAARLSTDSYRNNPVGTFPKSVNDPKTKEERRLPELIKALMRSSS